MGVAGSRVGLSNVMYHCACSDDGVHSYRSRSRPPQGLEPRRSLKRGELHPLFGDMSPRTQPILLDSSDFSNHAFGRLLSNIRIYRPEVLSAVLVLGFSFELVDMELCDFKRRDFGLLARLAIEL